MADYYTNMSFEFDMPSEAMASKAVKLLAEIEECIEAEKLTANLKGFEHFVKEGMQASICVEADGTKVWVRDDCGQPFLELVAAWLQEVLKRYHPEGAIGFDYSHDCSKKRANSFGGGAVFITKDTDQWMNTWQWLADTEKDWVADGAPGKHDE